MRDTAAAALTADARFGGWTAMSAWARDYDPSLLPAFAVATPQERSVAAAVDTIRRETDLVVQFRQEGGDDLEDTMDADSAAAEAAILTAFEALASPFADMEIVSSDTTIEGDGAMRIGHLNLQFRVTRFTAPGAA